MLAKGDLPIHKNQGKILMESLERIIIDGKSSDY